MTLIEVLFYYRDVLQVKGRDAANEWLRDTTDIDLWEDITSSLSDTGEFITAEGHTFNYKHR